MAIQVALIGFGKIAKDQHLPAILGTADFELAAVITPFGEGVVGAPLFRTVAEARVSGIPIDAAILCNRPVDRRESALAAIAANWHLLMEKPPGLTVSEVEAVGRAARIAGLALITAWHSRQNSAVDTAIKAVRDRTPKHITIGWYEDVAVWHPGQIWIWETGGFGVFDPGINALAIVTKIFEDAWLIDRSDLQYPAGAQTPIFANLKLSSATRGLTLDATFDWRAQRQDSWTIDIQCDEGSVSLSNGGRSLSIDGEQIVSHGDEEYPALYAQFARAIRGREVFIDTRPLALVVDALAMGTRTQSEADTSAR